MNTNKHESEETYSRLNGGELGPVGLILLFLLMVAMSPLLLWECVKWLVLMILPRRDAENTKKVSANCAN